MPEEVKIINFTNGETLVDVLSKNGFIVGNIQEIKLSDGNLVEDLNIKATDDRFVIDGEIVKLQFS